MQASGVLCVPEGITCKSVVCSVCLRGSHASLCVPEGITCKSVVCSVCLRGSHASLCVPEGITCKSVVCSVCLMRGSHASYGKPAIMVRVRLLHITAITLMSHKIISLLVVKDESFFNVCTEFLHFPKSVLLGSNLHCSGLDCFQLLL